MVTGQALSGPNAQNSPPPALRPPIPPSPTAAALGIYGNVPVGYATGVPSISLPLYELKSHDLSVPISISYHSTGLQVEGSASSAGLGWSLNAGGTISRTQFGKDDFGYYGYATSQNTLPSFGTEPDYLATGAPRAAYDLALYLFDPFGNSGGDFEPDLYNFSFNGRNGKFVHDTQGNPRVIPYQALEISRYSTANSSSSGYKITDENGIQYYFDESETTRLVETQNCPFNIQLPFPFPFTSGYSLRTMVSPSGDTIKFEYELDLSSYQNPSNDPRFDLQIGCTDCRPILLPANPCVSKTKHLGSRIKRITTATGEQAVFDYDAAERLDLVQNNRLQAVRILNQKGIQIHRFELYHSYFIGTVSNDPDPLNQSQAYRLRLDSLRESGKPAHKFTYYHQDAVFPNRLAYSQDLWGYYNRENNNTTLYPAMQYGDRFYAGANRAVDTMGTKFGMLRSIQYPTGGRTVFDFENNRLDDANTPVDSTISVGVHAYVYNNNNEHFRDRASMTFTVTQSERIRLTYSFTLSQPAEGFVGAHASGDLTGAATGLSMHYQCGQGTSCGDAIYMTLEPDTYTVAIEADANSNNSDGVGSMSITRKSLKSILVPQYAGGCRIRRITDCARGNKVASLRTFVYKNTVTGLSSGIPGVTPLLNYQQDIKHYDPNLHVTQTNTYLVRVPRSTIPQNAIQGGNISYSCVTEVNGLNGEGGKSEYYFEAVGDESSHVGYPFTPPISYDWMRGQLVKQVDYRKAGNTYQMVKAMRQQYTRNFDRTSFFSGGIVPTHQVIIPAFVAACTLPQYFSSNGSSTFTLVPGEYTFHWYYYISAWQYLKSTTEVLYNPVDTTQQTATVTRYRYDNAQHLQLTHWSKSTSSQDSTWKQFRYPLDYGQLPATATSAALRGIQWLQQHHQLTPVLEQQEGTKRSQTPWVTAGKFTTYALGQPWQRYSLNLAAPLEQQQLVASSIQNGQVQRDSHYQLREEIVLRDLAGNALQVEQDKVPTSFIWGYDRSLVVAKVANAAYSQVSYSSFENQELNTWTGNRLGIQGSLAYSGKYSYLLSAGSLSKAALAAGTYGLSVWVREGSGTVFTNALPFTATNTLIRGWRLYRAETVLGANATATISGTGQIDDLRLCPKDGQMITYTHEPMVGVTSQTGADGRTIFFEYDALGRLVRTRDEQGRMLSQQQYHYAGN